jgi:hypothetical protein
MGEEDPDEYNARVEQAFDARRVKAWPYEGGIAVAEESPDGSRREIFVIDNWCLLASFRSVSGTFEQDTYGQHRFDYDTYKLLFVFLTDQESRLTITPFDPARLTKIVQQGVFTDLPTPTFPLKP